MRRTTYWLLSALTAAGWLAAHSAQAAGTAGSIHGTVQGPDGKPMAAVLVQLRNDISGFKSETTTGKDGSFVLFNIPFNPYELHVEVQGFRPVHQNLDVRNSIPQEVVIHLDLPAVSESVSVMGEPTAAQLETDNTTSHIDIDKSYIARAPAAVPMRAMEEIVTSTPGFALDENGRYHFQGAHSQSEYVIDGQTISDQTGVTFSNSIDPGIAQSLEVIYGNVPAEFGEKVGAVINMTTKSGLGAPFKGSAIGSFATFDTYQGGVSLGGGTDRFGVYASINAAGSDYFTDPVNPDNLHNVGNTQRIFLRLDTASPGFSNAFRFSVLLGRTDRDVTNTYTQEIAGQAQDVKTYDQNYNFGWQNVASAASVVDVTAFGAAGEVHALSFRRRHSHHVELEPRARQLRHHALLHLDDRHSRDQGGRHLQAVSDQRALPVRDHRPELQRSRFPRLQPQPRSLRPDARRHGVPVRRSPDGRLRRRLRSGQHPLEEPDGEHRRALRSQQPAGHRRAVVAAHRPRLLHPIDGLGLARHVQPRPLHSGIREHPPELFGGGGRDRSARGHGFTPPRRRSPPRPVRAAECLHRRASSRRSARSSGSTSTTGGGARRTPATRISS